MLKEVHLQSIDPKVRMTIECAVSHKNCETARQVQLNYKRGGRDGGGAVTYSLQLAQCIRTYTTHTLPHKLIMCNTSFLKNLVTLNIQNL